MKKLSFYLLLSFAILQIVGCAGCGNKSQPAVNLTYSAEVCAPNTVLLENLTENAPPQYDVPDGCGGPEVRSRQLLLDVPADGNLTLNVRNGQPGTTYLRLFGLKDGAATMITDCQQSIAAYQSVPLTVPPGVAYESLLLDFRYDPVGKYGVVDTSDFIALEIHDDYAPVSNGPNVGNAPVGCDTTRSTRILISSCDPDAAIEEWAVEMGLTVRQTTRSLGGKTVAAVAPFDITTNAAGGKGKDKGDSVRETMERDSTNFFVEEDFLITLPVPAENNLYTFSPNQQEIDEEPIGLAQCLFEGQARASVAGEGNFVAVIIDSGVDEAQEFYWNRHRFLDPIGTPFLPANAWGYDFITDDGRPDDELGHGTAVAHTLLSNYGFETPTPLQLVNYKVFGGDGKATYFGAIVAINAALENGADLINLSWGVRREEAPEALACALRNASARGVAIVTTAGNDSLSIDREPQWPGAFAGEPGFENVVTVGSYVYTDNDPDQAPQRAGYSNYGAERVSLKAYLTFPTRTFGSSNDFSRIAGTSISAPIVSGKLAAALQGGGSVMNFLGGLPKAPSLDTLAVGGRWLPACE